MHYYFLTRTCLHAEKMAGSLQEDGTQMPVAEAQNGSATGFVWHICNLVVKRRDWGREGRMSKGFLEVSFQSSHFTKSLFSFSWRKAAKSLRCSFFCLYYDEQQSHTNHTNDWQNCLEAIGVEAIHVSCSAKLVCQDLNKVFTGNRWFD